MKLHIGKNQELAKVTLVDLRPRLMALEKENKHVVFITISPNPSKKYSILRGSKKIKIQYNNMTHDEQHRYLHEYISAVYVSIFEYKDWMYYVYEINEDNNLHVHGILYSESIQTEYDLKCLQKTVYSHQLTVYNRATGSKRDYMNNIVYYDNKHKDLIEYLSKQKDIKNNFPDVYIER